MNHINNVYNQIIINMMYHLFNIKIFDEDPDYDYKSSHIIHKLLIIIDL